MEKELNLKKEYSPGDFFTELKSKKEVMTTQKLNDVYENCMYLMNEYQRSGQILAQKKLLFHMDNIAKEHQLVNLGIDTYIYKQDIDDYIHIVDNRVVKIIELEKYERRIPEEIIQAIEKTKNIFDRIYILFTDYTGREERKVKAEARNKDPIIFGTFQNRELATVVERFYVLGDWEDEYCDLTLDKMVADMQRLKNKDIAMKINTPEDIEQLRNQLNNLEMTRDGTFRQVKPKEEPAKKSFFAKVKSFVTGGI